VAQPGLTTGKAECLMPQPTFAAVELRVRSRSKATFTAELGLRRFSCGEQPAAALDTAAQR
jgi:hypothetical protein